NQRQKYFLLGETSYQDINTHSQSHRILRIHIIQGARLVITGPAICASVITRSNLQNHLRKHCASGAAPSTSETERPLEGLRGWDWATSMDWAAGGDWLELCWITNRKEIGPAPQEQDQEIYAN